jgi:hypothetical protein
MITLDRIKIKTNSRYVKHMDTISSSVISRNNIEEAVRYNQGKPYKLYINNSLKDNKCNIEFSAKVLGDEYYQLINKDNIRQCLENINGLGLCRFEVEDIVNESEVMSLDITSDISGISIPDRIAVKSCLRYINKYHIEKYSRDGITIMKDAKTPNRKERLIIYDKYKELHNADNRAFINSIDDAYAMFSRFYGKFRVEANVKTHKQIRDLFQVESIKLLDVLHSDANPLLTLFDNIFNVPDTRVYKVDETQTLLSYESFNDMKDALILKACDNDLEKVDLLLKNYLAPTTNKKVYRDKFIKLLNNTNPATNMNFTIMKKVREEIVNC